MKQKTVGSWRTAEGVQTKRARAPNWFVIWLIASLTTPESCCYMLKKKEAVNSAISARFSNQNIFLLIAMEKQASKLKA
jgi:hypothetical protein